MLESVEVTIRQPGYPDRSVTLQEGASRLGRAEDNELVLSDVGVSRRHAQVYWSRTECLIEDLGSGNGTYYQGHRIQSQPLHDGDELVIDPFVVHFSIRGSMRPVAEAQQPAPARLEMVVGTGMAGSSHAIGEAGLTIGRSEDRDVVIPDPASSRHHASIVHENERFMLRDMGSANGIFVNAVRVRDQELHDGDLLRIGNTEMRFVRYSQEERDNHTWPSATSSNDPPAGRIPSSGAPAEPTLLALIDPPAKKGSPLWLILSALTLVAGLVFLVVVICVIILLSITLESPPTPIPAHAPSWTLQLPDGLQEDGTDLLFKEGVAEVRNNNFGEALQNFFRVLNVDPGNNSAQKFAFAAGETLVLQELETHLDTKVKARIEREAQRTQLLRDVTRTGRVGRAAKTQLEEHFQDDPLVIQEMKWSPSKTSEKVNEWLATADKALGNDDFPAAADAYRSVLTLTVEPDQRGRAVTGLKMASKELGRKVSTQWRTGVVAEVLGQRAAADAAFDEVRTIDANNACATLPPR